MEDPLLQALSENGDDLVAGLKAVARSEICVIVTKGAVVGLNLDGSKITDAGLRNSADRNNFAGWVSRAPCGLRSRRQSILHRGGATREPGIWEVSQR